MAGRCERKQGKWRGEIGRETPSRRVATSAQPVLLVSGRKTRWSADHSDAKIRFQSFFMLMTIQPRSFASAIRASGKVPTFDFGP